MPITTRPSGGGFDPTKYRPMSYDGSILMGAVGTWSTLVSVTGKGFFNQAVSVRNATNHRLRITLDGVVVFDGVATTGSGATGVVINDYAATGQVRVGGTARLLAVPIVSFPFTAGTAGLCIVYEPIIFNTSLLVEIQSTALNESVPYGIGGGVI